MARIGKIARLPENIREELNKRIRGGQLGPQLLPWLNGLAEVRGVLTEFFNGQDISAQNLSDWRNGGYAEWEERQERSYVRVERIRELSRMSMKLAMANGGNLSEGAASILGGSILELLEQVEELKSSTEGNEGNEGRIKAAAEALDSLTNAVARLRRGDHDAKMLQQNDKRLEQKDKDLALAEKKFQRETCSLFIKWCEDQRALEAATGTGDNSAKIERLGQLMFGEDWKPAEQ
jgi:hypothetical protein